MTNHDSSFDASAPALGYLHQCQYALLLGLQRDEVDDVAISIEKLDDIAFHDSPTSPQLAKEMLQVKHHVNRAGGLGDSSPDIWKTLRVWAEAVNRKQIDINNATLCLLTTSTPTKTNAIRLLSPDGSIRNSEEGRKKLEAAGKRSENQVVRGAYLSYMALPEPQRTKLFQSVFLLHTSLAAVDLQAAIAQALRHAVERKHLAAFIERLVGWWFQRVVHHLSETVCNPIPLDAIQRQIHEIRKQFHRDCLPDDLLGQELPPEATPEDDDRIFVRQLQLIGISRSRLQLAQEDHHRAFTQRSRWVKDDLIEMHELSTFEDRLIDGWRRKYLIMKDEVVKGCEEPTLQNHGFNLYKWIEGDAPNQSSLWIRPQFQSPYMVLGSYQILADALRVGWHPDYRERILPSEEDTGREPT